MWRTRACDQGVDDGMEVLEERQLAYTVCIPGVDAGSIGISTAQSNHRGGGGVVLFCFALFCFVVDVVSWQQGHIIHVARLGSIGNLSVWTENYLIGSPPYTMLPFTDGRKQT